jgi:predicted RNA binding protein YcfA (HicA-like mRNA interferase family)
MCAHIFAHAEWDLQHETNTRKIVARLLREGWENVGGGNHERFVKSGFPMVVVPRHSTVSPQVARSIAKSAGWQLRNN